MSTAVVHTRHPGVMRHGRLTGPKGGEGMEDSNSLTTLLTKVRQIGPHLREHAGTAEGERKLAEPAFRAMQEADLFLMWRPRAYGGLEVAPTTGFRVVEEVARFDGAAAWNLQISMGGDMFLAWLPQAGAEEILSNPQTTIAVGWFRPPRAVSLRHVTGPETQLLGLAR